MKAVASHSPPIVRNGYPTSSKKPMPETDWHRELMVMLIHMLQTFFAQQQVYVSGNLLIFYEEGNRRRHISPDVFVVRGVASHDRPNFLVWEEGRGPEVAIELTSSTTHRTDLGSKMTLYQNTLRVREYFLFDPHADYLDPPLQGYRLRKGVYQRIDPQQDRLPSQVLGLHLEREGRMLRLWNPTTWSWLLTPAERQHQTEQRAEHAEQRAELAEERAAALAEENERLRRQLPPPQP